MVSIGMAAQVCVVSVRDIDDTGGIRFGARVVDFVVNG